MPNRDRSAATGGSAAASVTAGVNGRSRDPKLLVERRTRISGVPSLGPGAIVPVPTWTAFHAPGFDCRAY